MGLQAEQIADIVAMVKDAEDRNTFTLLTTELQRYSAMRQLFRAKGRTEKGGEQLSFNVMVDSNESAQTTSLFAEIDISQADLFTKGRIPWRHVTNFYAFDEREPEINSRPDDLVDIVKGRRTDAFVDLAKKFETWFWEAPTGSEASDDKPPFGVKYWVGRNNTIDTGAFQGDGTNAAPISAFSSGCAGLSSLTYKNWQNYSVGYVAVSEDDFVARLDKAAWSCDFENPVPIPGSVSSNYGFYTTYPVRAGLKAISRNRNDNLGFDIESRNPTYMGNQIEAVPYLTKNDASAAPFYGIDWSIFKPVFLRGEWMKEVTIIHPGKQHRVVATFIDSSLNIECKNRRKLFVLYVA